MIDKDLEKLIEEKDEQIARLERVCAEFDEELSTYRDAARLYGVDPQIMLALARSKILTCADNIRIMEKMQEVLDLFRYVPKNLDEHDLTSALVQYDGDGSKPYCDLVHCGLDLIRRYYGKRSEYEEWRKGHLPF